MKIAADNQSTLQLPLRVWPAVVLVVLQWLVRFGLPVVKPEAVFVGVIAGLIGGLALLIWWLFFSRAPWIERIGALVFMFVALFTTKRIVHKSISMGAMGMLFPILAIPVLCLVFVASAVLTRRMSTRARRVSMAGAIVLACVPLMLIRTGGFTGDFNNDFAWRWTQTAEERLLVKDHEEPTVAAPSVAPTIREQPITPKDVAVVLPTAPSQVMPKIEWPGFRGPKRDGVVHGIRIMTDWSASPPVEMWRRQIGPGWSSFAVQGDLFYTQEQRGDDEVVTCYKMSNGKPVWRHRDHTRFWESNAGAGPRATPTLNNDRVYSFGATGILNALESTDGTVIWSRNVAADTKTETPGWGFASSPLVTDEMVIIAVAGQLAAYDAVTGRPRWFGEKGGDDYSSPHSVTIDGVPQVLLLNGPGVTSVSPSDGKVLWKYPLASGTRIVQPAQMDDGDLLITEGDQRGLRRIAITHGSRGWGVKEGWTSNGLKPYFNDFVVHQDHAFGFDGSYLSCIDLKDGERKWKGGHYGAGQLILLADQDVLLVVSEKGELVLVSATAEQFTELARFPAIEGKTWNHPVLARNVLLVRNGEEMAAFRLALAKQ